jgi:hypothetical protein
MLIVLNPMLSIAMWGDLLHQPSYIYSMIGPLKHSKWKIQG